jgi:microcin C transport system substrate-binding protein
MTRVLRLLAAALVAAAVAAPGAGTASAQPAPAGETPAPGVTRTWAFAEFGEPLYGPDMAHWPYARPDAPKGGSVTLGAFGTFDSLNTLVERVTWPAGIGLVTDGLMVGSGDELSSFYGHMAEWAEYPEDLSWIRFRIRPEARWHDGRTITADDFVFAFDTIREHGRLFLKSFYEDIARATAEDERTVRFDMRTTGSMKPLTVAAGMSPLPRHWWSQPGRDITRGTLEPPLGSGPYRVKSVDAGRSIVYQRVADWWAKDLPTSRGLYNFDEIRYDYYRDDGVMFEAFLAGRIDLRGENRAQRWVQGYDTEAVRQGRIQRIEVPSESPRGAYGLVMNTRRPQFADIRVRHALEMLYDFESVQRTILFGQYTRLKSWFPKPSEYSASGPPTPEELAILEPFRDRLPPEVLTQAFEPSRTDGSGNIRAQQRDALRLLREAGWTVRDNRLVDAQGRPFAMEILLRDASMSRVVEPYVQNLRRVGIDASIRVVDTAQYGNRTDDYDFDVVMVAFTFFPPPGNELLSFYSSAAADRPAEGNYAGIKDPVVDALIARIVAATDAAEVEAATRALDRVLLWGRYIVHFWTNDVVWIAHWDRFGRPERSSRFGSGDFPTTWWADPARSAAAAPR